MLEFSQLNVRVGTSDAVNVRKTNINSVQHSLLVRKGR